MLPYIVLVVCVLGLQSCTCSLLPIIMKGTEVLTLGAGREILPDVDIIIYTPSSYTHAIHVYLRMRCTVNWWAGWSFY